MLNDVRRDFEHEQEIRVTCLVDNTADLRAGLWAEHGSAFLVERGDSKILFDTGQSGEVLSHNLSVLQKDLSDLSSIVLSHGHYDHAGGLVRALSLAGDVEVVAHPGVFDRRFARSENGEDKDVGIPFSREDLEAGCRLRLSKGPVEVAPGIFTTGQITRGNGPEPRDARLVVRDEDGAKPDPLLDDMSLVLMGHHGLVVLTGCCHSGLVNTLEHVRITFSDDIRAIVGGTHLARADYTTLQESVMATKERFGVSYVYVGHCTGERGFLAFEKTFGQHCRTCPAGLSLTF
jgi:7,8-dihydropterin-6-yl-methyl-4-(beta-D-ribofuranosyl)aminobenzene 5'-phosphate synthase